MERNFDAVYAPVVDFTNDLLVLAVALQLRWSTRHIDFKTAFLNGEMDRETYVSHPVNLPQQMQNKNTTNWRRCSMDCAKRRCAGS